MSELPRGASGDFDAEFAPKYVARVPTKWQVLLSYEPLKSELSMPMLIKRGGDSTSPQVDGELWRTSCSVARRFLNLVTLVNEIMQIITTLLSFIVPVLLVAVAIAQTAHESPRKLVNPRGPFAKLTGQITQLVPFDNGYGNGFIVGADGCHVLTNFHVAFGMATDSETSEIEMVDKIEVGHTVNFTFDLDASLGKFRRSSKAKVVGFGNYEAGTSQGFLGDIALLRLERCLGKDYGQLEMDRPPAEKRVSSGKLMTVSLSRNRNGINEVLVEEGCRASGATSVTGMMLSNCDSVPGMSGSMILEEGEDKRWRLAGISTDRSKYADGTKVSQAIYIKIINKFLDRSNGLIK